VLLHHGRSRRDDVPDLFPADSHGPATGQGPGDGDGPGQVVNGPVAAQDGCGFAAPNPALVGFGSELVLGVPGLQGGLLGQLDGLDRGRRPAVVGLELDSQGGPPGVDGSPPGRPGRGQLFGDPDDLADAAPACGGGRGGVGAFGEGQAEPGVQLRLEAGVVPLRR